MQSFASLPEYGRFLRCTLLLTIGAIAACGSSDDSGDDAAACPAMIGSRCVTAKVPGIGRGSADMVRNTEAVFTGESQMTNGT